MTVKLIRLNGTVIGEGESVQKAVAMLRANLRWADLTGANLREADLARANLRWADLTGANLREANLRGADLSEADLRGADLREADLDGANLTGANLARANLTGANLARANLTEANLDGTGCLSMQCGPWSVWITPTICRIGCQQHEHDFWLAATSESVAHMNGRAERFWRHWGAMIQAACRACAQHGWPKESVK